jgi:hypothetical protein
VSCYWDYTVCVYTCTYLLSHKICNPSYFLDLKMLVPFGSNGLRDAQEIGKAHIWMCLYFQTRLSWVSAKWLVPSNRLWAWMEQKHGKWKILPLAHAQPFLNGCNFLTPVNIYLQVLQPWSAHFTNGSPGAFRSQSPGLRLCHCSLFCCTWLHGCSSSGFLCLFNLQRPFSLWSQGPIC